MPTFVPIDGAFCRSWMRAATAAALEADGRQGGLIDLPSSENQHNRAGRAAGEHHCRVPHIGPDRHRDRARRTLRGGTVLTEFAGTGQCGTAYA